MLKKEFITNAPMSYNINLIPKKGTMIERLVAESMPVTDKDVPMDEIGKEVEIKTSSKDGEPSPHSLYQDEFIKDISKAVRTHLSFAKTEVMPVIKDITEYVTTFVSDCQNNNYVLNLEMVPIEIHPIFEDSSLLDLLEDYAHLDSTSALDYITLGDKDYSELKVLALSEDKHLNEDLIEYFSSNTRGKKFMRDPLYVAYNTFFNPESDFKTSLDAIEKDVPNFKLAVYLAVFLMAIRLIDNPPSNLNMDFLDYKTKLVGIRNAAGRKIHSTLKTFESFENTGTVLYNSSPGDIIFVSKKNYTEFVNEVEEGQSVVLGSFVSENSKYGAASLKTSKDLFLAIWRDYTEVQQIRSREQIATEISLALSNYLVVGSPDTKLTETEEEYLVDNPNYVAECRERASEFAKNFSLKKLDDIEDYITDYVLETRFFFTSAKTIINGMREAGRLNKDLEPREAAYLSVIDYLIDFFVDQVIAEEIDLEPEAVTSAGGGRYV